MKKISFLLMGAAAIFAAACSNEDLGTLSGDTAVVTLTAKVPGNIATRAISDGMTARQLTYAVYEIGQTNASPLICETVKMDDEALTATVTMTLVKGQGYDIVFWADAKENSIYTFNETTKTVTVSYDDLTGNNENRDAFFASYTIEQVTGAIEKTITLKRPFAQINFGTNDLEAIKTLGYDPTKFTYAVTVPGGLPNTLNLLDGTVDGETTEMTFSATGYVEDDDNTFPVEDGYTWLTMDYILVPADKQVLDGDLLLTVSGDKLPEETVVTVSNVPVQRNYRTNIYGSILTNPAEFNVTIDPSWTGNKNIQVIKSAATADELVAGIEDGAYINLTANVTVSSAYALNEALAAADNVTFDLNGNTLTIDTQDQGSATTTTKRLQVGSGASLTMCNGTLVTLMPATNLGTVMIDEGSSLIIDNMTIKSNGTLLFPKGTAASVTITNSTITATSYVLGTNASSISNSGVEITIDNSKLAAQTAVYINVPGTLNVSNSELYGGRQACFVRGGTATFTNTSLTLDSQYYSEGETDISDDDKSGYVGTDWGSGNAIPVAALTLGNNSTTSYLYPTVCTLTDCQLTGYEDYWAIFADATSTCTVTLDYTGCTFSPELDTEKSFQAGTSAGKYIYVNGVEQTASED